MRFNKNKNKIIYTFLDVFIYYTHGTFIRWYLRNWCVRNEISLLFDLLSISLRHSIRSRRVTNLIIDPKTHIFLHACASFSELPSNMISMNTPMIAFIAVLKAFSQTKLSRSLYISSIKIPHVDLNILIWL